MNNKQEVIITEKKEIVAATPETANILTALIEAAKNPDIDLDRIDKLMDIKERIEAGEARKLFAIDFADMKPHLPRVIKKGKNTQTGSSYAFLDDVNAAVDPVLSKYGFATSTKVVDQTPDLITVEAQLWHRSGHVETTKVSMPPDATGAKGNVNKTQLHAIKSTITYLKGTAICALLNVSTGDDIDGNTVVETITTEQAAALDLRLRAISDKALPNFLKWGKVESLMDIFAKNYTAAERAVSNMEQEAKQRATKE